MPTTPDPERRLGLPERRVDTAALRDEVASLAAAVDTLAPAVMGLLPDAKRISTAARRLLIGFVVINVVSIIAVMVFVVLWVDGEIHSVKADITHSRKIVECVMTVPEASRDNVHILTCEQANP